MKAGSLVECLQDYGPLPHFIQCNRPSPKKGDIETVEEVSDTNGLKLVGFEFTVRPFCDCIIHDVWFDAKYWRVVQPPADLSFVDDLQFEMVS